MKGKMYDLQDYCINLYHFLSNVGVLLYYPSYRDIDAYLGIKY